MASWRDTYFLAEEVLSHNTAHDCWVVIYRVVKNITPLIAEYCGTELVRPLLAEAGKDISFWFEPSGFNPTLKTCLHPETGFRVSVLPYRIPHAPDPEPDVGWMPDTGDPWWQDQKYNVGMETKRPVLVRLSNPLINRSAIIKVCLEDTVDRILKRYSSKYNPDIGSYTVKYLGRRLSKAETLPANRVTLPYSTEILDLVQQEFVPTLMLYYRERLAPCPPLKP